MVQKIGQITNGDILINETDVAGRIDELDLGEIAHKDVEHETLGMIGVISLPGRGLESIKGKIKFGWLDAETERTIINPTKFTKLQIHSYVDVMGPDGLDIEKSHTLVTHLTYSMIKKGGTTAKLADKMGVEHDISIHSFSQKVYGDTVPIIEIDLFAQIYNVNGEPVWPK